MLAPGRVAVASAPNYNADYKTLSDRLLRVIAQSANLAGNGRMQLGADQRNVRQRIQQITNEPPEGHLAARVADARFALGADDGAYLRANVMPLQTTDPECDATSLTARPMREIEAASRRGVLQALDDEFTQRISATSSELAGIADLLSWLLSIKEIAQFAKLKHDTGKRNTESVSAVEEAASVIVDDFADGSRHSIAHSKLKKAGDHVVCMIVTTVLTIFGVPAEAVRQQLATTLGSESTPEGGGMDTLHDAIDRLALSARFTKEVYDADKVAVYSSPEEMQRRLVAARARTRAQNNVAVGVNASLFGRIDFSATTVPVGFNMELEMAPHGSDAASRGILQRMAWNMGTEATLEELWLLEDNPEYSNWETNGGTFTTAPPEKRVNDGKAIKRFDDKAAAKKDAEDKADEDVQIAEVTIDSLKAALSSYARAGALYKDKSDEIELQTLLLAWKRALSDESRRYGFLFEAEATVLKWIVEFVKLLEASLRTSDLNVGADQEKLADDRKNVQDEYAKMFPEGAGWIWRQSNADKAVADLGRGGYAPEGLFAIGLKWRFALASMIQFVDLNDESIDVRELTKRMDPADTTLQQGWAEWLKLTKRPKVSMLTQLRELEKHAKGILSNQDGKRVWPGDAFSKLIDAVEARNSSVIPTYNAIQATKERQSAYERFNDNFEKERQERSDEEKQRREKEEEDTKKLIDALAANAKPDFCDPAPYFAAAEKSQEDVHDGLCAAFTQMREDGGFSVASGPTALERFIERRSGISPFFLEPRWRALARDAGDEDWWSKRIWGTGGERLEPVPLPELPRRLDDAIGFRTELPSALRPASGRNGASSAAAGPTGATGDSGGSAPTRTLSRALKYALARGLCAVRAPHHKPANGETNLAYNLPMLAWPGLKAPATEAPRPTLEERSEQLVLFSARSLEPKADFVSAPLPYAPIPQEPVPEETKVARWAPVAPRYTDDGYYVFAPSGRNVANEVADAVVHEVLVDYYKDVAATAANDDTLRLLATGAAAYTKVLQLPSLCAVMEVQNKATICPAHPLITDQASLYSFFTRPVLRCPGVDNFVLYPCDAGLAAYSMYIADNVPLDPQSRPGSGVTPPDPDKAFGAIEQPAAAAAAAAAGQERTPVKRSEATSYMRSALGRSENTIDGDAPTTQERATVPLYVAEPPGGSGAAIATVIDGMLAARNPDNKQLFRDAAVPDALPKTDEAKAAIQANALVAALRAAFEKCTSLADYRCEQDAVKKRLKEEDERVRLGDPCDDPTTPDAGARERREAVWNDAMREACISGDRLYAFARQLAGTIGEQVDSVCMIDEGLLVRQQQDRRASRQRLTDRAAQEHMQLVRNVFGAVIKESGLTLGIDGTGDVGELKVVSNTLRKQATELAAGGSSSEGYFANSVRLENLLATGTSEMTLNGLFEKLGDAGRALQQAALSAQGSDALPGTTLEFLSAPRNSLLIRWKVEALAAISHAFHLYQREMLYQNGPTYRTISAYELIEGCDDALCSAFAQFCAHCLVHSRLFATSTAAYIAQWPAAANAAQMKISLTRLVNLASEYLVRTPSPSFLSEDGRANYFTSSGNSRGGYGVPWVTGRHVPQPGGMWARDFYK